VIRIAKKESLGRGILWRVYGVGGGAGGRDFSQRALKLFLGTVLKKFSGNFSRKYF
jgi:hypothetical protein